MKLNMNFRHTVVGGIIALAVTSLSGGGIAIADQSSGAASLSLAATTACFSTHNFSSGANAMNICFTKNGNLIKFTSPAGFEHIQVGTFAEGYLLNDLGSGANYYDVGAADAGFGASVVNQPNGANTFPLTITRSTTDGIFKLKQVFSWGTATKNVNIVMTLTNNTTVSRTVKLTRYYDGDIDGTTGGDLYARTNDSVLAWEDGVGHHGLELVSLSLSTGHSTLVDIFTTGNGGVLPAGVATPTLPGDYEGYLTHNLTIGGSQSKTITVQYKRI